MAHAAAQPGLVDPDEVSKEGNRFAESERSAQFAILLALHCAVVSNRLFGWRTLDLAFKSYIEPTIRSNG